MAASSENINIPKWVWGAVGFVLCTFTGSLGTWVGYTLVDHEKRLIHIESTKFTANDGKALFNELKVDLKVDISDLKDDISILRDDISDMRDEINKVSK